MLGGSFTRCRYASRGAGIPLIVFSEVLKPVCHLLVVERERSSSLIFPVQFACKSTKALSTKWAPGETMIYHFVVSKKERNEQSKVGLCGLLLRAHGCFPEFPSSCPGCLDQGPLLGAGHGPVQASLSCAPGASSGAVPPLWDIPGFKQLVPPHPSAGRRNSKIPWGI